MKFIVFIHLVFLPLLATAQLKWKNVDSLYQPLPSSIHVYFTNDSLDGKPNIAYYLEADLQDKGLNFTTEVGNGKRYTPAQYYQKAGNPLVVINTTFFEFAHNSNLNVVIRDGKTVAYNQHTIAGRRNDTLTYLHPFAGAFGISKSRKADIAWTFTDSSKRRVYAMQVPVAATRDSTPVFTFKNARDHVAAFAQNGLHPKLSKWKMKTAFGGGPVLVQNGEVKITNNEERKFAGKAINDKHPRTTIGYTKDQKLIILMLQGRTPGKAEGASLTQAATILQSLGCTEAINLDGGGSSCLLVNGRETIAPSDKEGQRAVPAVFIIK